MASVIKVVAIKIAIAAFVVLDVTPASALTTSTVIANSSFALRAPASFY